MTHCYRQQNWNEILKLLLLIKVCAFIDDSCAVFNNVYALWGLILPKKRLVITLSDCSWIDQAPGWRRVYVCLCPSSTRTSPCEKTTCFLTGLLHQVHVYILIKRVFECWKCENVAIPFNLIDYDERFRRVQLYLVTVHRHLP